MLPTFLQNAIPESIKQKTPNLFSIIGVKTSPENLAQNGDLLNLFAKFGYKRTALSDISYTCPIYKYTGLRDITFTIRSNIQISGGSLPSEDAIPNVDSNILGSNFINQYAGVKPITITIQGMFGSKYNELTTLEQTVDNFVKQTNSIANTFKPNALKKFNDKYNKIKDSYNNILNKVNGYLNQAQNLFNTASKVYDTIKSRDINTLLSNNQKDYEIAKFIWATVLLNYARCPIDLSVCEIPFKKMLLVDFMLDRPQDTQSFLLNYSLTFQYAFQYGNNSNVDNNIQNKCALNKNLGNISDITYAN